MKLKIILLFLSLISIQTAFAQNSFIKVSVGLNRANAQIGSLDFKPDESFKTGFLTQVTYNRPFHPNLYWGAGVGYYKKGFKSTIQLFDEFALPIGEDELKWNFNYIGMPMYLGFRKGHNSKFIAEIGIIPSFLTKAIATFPDITGGGQTEMDATDGLNDLDVPVFALVGFRQDLNDTYALEFSFSMQQSLTGVGFIDGSTSEDWHHLTYNLMVGVVYQLDK